MEDLLGANRLPGLNKRQKERRREERKQAKAERLALRRARKKEQHDGTLPGAGSETPDETGEPGKTRA